ncbi:MAG: hypothetical protein HY866_18755 [Chloroflexi bacterium]|nr:hypothetical protein [Chloroflexota bacterium]
MPCTVTRLAGEPILILQFDLNLEDRLSSLRSVQSQVASIAAATGGLLVVIADLREHDVKYSDFLLMAHDMPHHPEGSPLDPRIRPAMIGDHPLIEIGVRKINQMLGIQIEHFATLEKALAWAREEIRRQTDQPPN